MNIVLSWLAIAGAAVLLIAVAVAWWEHRRRVATRHADTAWLDTEVNGGVLAGAAKLDLDLGEHPAQGATRVDLRGDEDEPAARQAVLASVIDRMSHHRSDQGQPNAWADTEPQVNPTQPGRARVDTAPH